MKVQKTSKVIKTAVRGRPKKNDAVRDARKAEIWSKILKEINK